MENNKNLGSCGGKCSCQNCTCGENCNCLELKAPQCDPCGDFTKNKKAQNESGPCDKCPCKDCTCGPDCKCAELKSPQCDPCSQSK